MPEPKQPSLRVKFSLEPYPLAASTIYRWGIEPLADAEFTEGRLTVDGYTEIERALSGSDGHYQGASFSFTARDDDRLISNLLQGATTEFFLNREASLQLLSAAGRAAGLAWRTVFRGHITDAQESDSFVFRATLQDVVGSEFSSLAMDRAIARTMITRDHFPNAPEGVVNTPYYVVFGEHSDQGSIDQNGDPNEKGMIPLRFLGWSSVSDDGTVTDDLPYMLEAPTISAAVVGTAGTRRYVYAVSAITNTGETRASLEFEILNGPATLSGANYVAITITPPTIPPDATGLSIIGYRVLGRDQTSTHLIILNNNNTWVTPETTYNDTGAATEKSPGAPAVPTSRYATLSGGGDTINGYAMFGGLLGAVKINKLFLSDVGGGGAVRTEPKRIHMPQEDIAEALTPHKDDGTPNPRWPHADPWVVRDGVRSTLIYLLGPRAQDAIDGRVTIAANVCGYDATGNHTGPIVDGAFPALQLFLNEFILKNGGEGYKNGSFGPLETFEDGTAMLRTSAFTAAQTVTASFVSGGYKAAWCITSPDLTLREFLQQFCLTFDCFIGVNEHGQVHPVVLDTALDPLAVGRHYREHIEIVKMFPPARAWAEIVNKLTYQFDWDTDGERWRYPPVSIEKTVSRAAYKGAWREQTIEGTCTRSLATMNDAQDRRATRLMYAPVYWAWETDIAGIEQQLGGIALLTHGDYNLLAHPVMVVRSRFNPNTNRVVLIGMDVARLF